MISNQERWFQHYLMLYEETQSFRCAQRLWLMSHHFNLTLPEYILEKFAEGIEKIDKEWNAPEPRHSDDFIVAQFIGDHMRQQKREKGKASKAAAIDAYVKMMIDEHDKELDAKTVEKRLERLAKFMEELGSR